MGFGDHRHGGEVEAVEGLAGQQPGLDEMAFDAAPVALGDLMFGERGEEAGGGPALLVGTLGEAGPSLPDRGQAQSPPPRRRGSLRIRVRRARSMSWGVMRLLR